MALSDPVRIVDVDGNIYGTTPDNPIYVAGGSGGGWFSDATAANQQTQIARAETANVILAAIQTAIAALDVDQDTIIGVLTALLSELSLKANLSDTQPVSAATLPLPTGAATDATLNNIISELGLIQSRLTELTDPGDTQPVSISSIPLPPGAATENTLLAVLTDMGDILTSLSFILTRLNILTDPTDTQPVSATSLPLPTGAAEEASLQAIITALGNMQTRLLLLSTEATQNSILTRLNALTDPADTQPVSLASIPLAPDAATDTGLATIYDQLVLMSARLDVLTDPNDTQPISAIALPLPTGAATLTAQTLGNDYLADIAAAFGIPAPDTALELLAAILAAIPGGGGPGGYALETTAQDILTRLLGLTDPSDTQPISAAILPLPTGAATEITLSALLLELQNKADLTETQPISAAALPLPAGAAKESRQITIIEQLGEVQASPTANTVLDRLKVIANTVSTETTLAAALAALGDIFTRLQNMTDPADTQPVSAASLPLPTGAATAANQTSIINAIGEIQDIPTQYTLLRRLKDLMPVAQTLNATGTGAISLTHTANQLCEVTSITLHLSSAPATSEDFVVTISYTGLATGTYDAVIFRLDLATAGVVDLFWQPDRRLILKPNDALKISWNNSNGRTWGLVTLMGVNV